MSEPRELTLENLSIHDIRGWNGSQMREYMKKPGWDVKIRELIFDAQQPVQPEPVVDAAAQQAAAETERQRVAAEQEAARKAAEAARPRRFVADYQVKDESGNPIGRPTHLEASSEEELRNKIINAHVEATRALHRWRNKAVTHNPPPVEPQQVGMSDQELLQAINDLKDPVKAVEAQKKISKSEFDRNLDPLKKENELLRAQISAQEVSRKFLQLHKNDFYNCQANIEKIAGYIKDNDLEWTLDNLDLALEAKESELAPFPSQQPVPPPANPVKDVVADTATQAAKAQETAAAAASSATTQQAAPVQQNTQPRPGVNGGIVPGESTATRPVTPQTPTRRFTFEQIAKWNAEEMKKHMRNPSEKAEIQEIILERNARRAALVAAAR
jgi:hypothetical protein